GRPCGLRSPEAPAGRRTQIDGGRLAALEVEETGRGDHRGVVGAVTRRGDRDAQASRLARAADLGAEEGIARHAARHDDRPDTLGLCRGERPLDQDVDDRALERGGDIQRFRRNRGARPRRLLYGTALAAVRTADAAWRAP